MKRFASPGTVIGRFVVRRSLRGAVLWAIIFGSFTASKAIGFVSAYPTEAAREQIAASFSNNIGIEIILGPPPLSASTAGYAAWNTSSVMIMIGAIWALMLATKLFRGEEDAGRWEILLSGQTTARRAAANVLAGLGAVLAVFYVIIAVSLILIGRAHGVDSSASSGLFFALTTISGIALFMAVGTLTSQLMPTRSRATAVAAAVFGAAFLLRAIGDITSAHWVLNFTPLGWLEKLQPWAGSQYIWFLPIVVSTVILVGLTLYFAGRRDLGEAIFADKDSSKPHLTLLNSPFAVAVRLTRAGNLGWLFTIAGVALLYGFMTKSAADAFSQSASLQHTLGRLAGQTQLTGAMIFLGVVYFLQMTIIMAYAASSISAIRRDEAEGYLDNFLVRPVGRLSWLGGRLILTAIVCLLAGLISALGVWLGIVSQYPGISFHTLIMASLNALVPVAVTLGFGIFALGLWPRLTSVIAYSVIGWSFLITMLSSGLNLSHWVLDTSIFHHVALAPAATANWGTNSILIGLALVLALVGAFAFNARDLANE